ncbi:MAG: sulfatase-like hydrolase/transferase [Bacteroidia bacterium]|nr:sulfatase-like hydrolase/transferase [Bacteroidia bacterium]
MISDAMMKPKILFLVNMLLMWINSGLAQNQPNILLIMADDQGYGDYGMSGNPILRTPNLDELSQNSIRFKHFYVAPVCAPTRAGLLTGRAPNEARTQRNQWLRNDKARRSDPGRNAKSRRVSHWYFWQMAPRRKLPQPAQCPGF